MPEVRLVNNFDYMSIAATFDQGRVTLTVGRRGVKCTTKPGVCSDKTLDRLCLALDRITQASSGGTLLERMNRLVVVAGMASDIDDMAILFEDEVPVKA